jgi:predicted membrane channel-forming protein YqfA (hemolysin III family)
MNADESQATTATSTTTAGVRLPGWLLVRRGETLSMHRLRQRLAAYIYGNILVLAAIGLATGASIASGTATLVVAVTTLTTYFAHVIAHDVSQHVGRKRGEHVSHTREELVDSLPIVFSGVIPVAILVAANWGLIGSELGQLAAGLWVIGRIALIGFLVERLSGRKPTFRTLSLGIWLALACMVIVVVKVLFAH